MNSLLFLFLIGQLTMTQVKDSIAPKYSAETTAYKVELTVDDKESQKVVQELLVLKNDKQIVGKNPRTVYAVEVMQYDEEGGQTVAICSGSFADKTNVLSWFGKLQKAIKTIPEIVPQNARFFLHTCCHSEDGKNLPCTREELMP